MTSTTVNGEPVSGSWKPALDRIEGRVGDLEAQRDALWAELERLRTGLTAAAVGLRFAAELDKEVASDGR
jgi:hypothetical protein